MLVALAVPAAAQMGMIQGTVTNAADGTPLPGVTVSVPDTNLFGVTGADGTYKITEVPAGTVDLNAELTGFKPLEQMADVPAGGTVTVDFELRLDVLSMDQIVVTGAISPYEKIESSVAVTTQTAEEIEQKAPLNTAQLLEVVPGFWSESSGGEGGNNLFARGIPQDGSFRYVAMYEDGLPVFESPELAFTNVDLLMRVDTTVNSMEAVRGGTSSIFASNAPAGLVNFVNKTGGEIPEGAVKFTIGDYDLFRLDFTYGGPLGENWRYQLGGFYRTDNGIRDPGFPANRGGQLKANITRLFDNGYLRFRAKHMDERNIFYLPIPLQNPSSPTGISGFDPNFGTLTTNDAAIVKIPTPDGDVLTRNLKDGMNPVLTQAGGELFLELDNGWTFKDSMRFTKADVLFNAVFSLFDPADANIFAQNQLGRVPGAVGYRYSYTHFPDLVFDPDNANGNGLVVNSGWWTVKKPLRQFVNDLRFTKQLPSNAFTLGFYVSAYDVDEQWIFNNILTEVRDQPRLLELELLDSNGDVLTSVTQDGFTRYGDFHRNASSDVELFAVYLSDEWQATPKLRIDTGIRYESSDMTGSVEELGTFDLGDPTTLADDSVTWGTGNFLPFDYSFDDVAVSVGLNYSFSPGFALYGRVSQGFRMPDLEQWTDGNVTERGSSEDVNQIEGGVKYSSPRVGAFASVFLSQFDNVPFTDEVIDPSGQLVTARRFASTETIGLEAEVIFEIVQNFQLGITATLQRPEFRDFKFTFGGQQFDFSGNQVRRIPEVLVSLRPSYRVGRFSVFGSWQYVDERFVDDANTITLPQYDVLDVGATYDLGRAVTLDLRVTNVTNSIGLTEGNPRTGQIVGVQQDIFMARPILGRAFRGSATLRF
jgi:outer membrane receptor protein involved in Fe transport